MQRKRRYFENSRNIIVHFGAFGVYMNYDVTIELLQAVTYSIFFFKFKNNRESA